MTNLRLYQILHEIFQEFHHTKSTWTLTTFGDMPEICNQQFSDNSPSITHGKEKFDQYPLLSQIVTIGRCEISTRQVCKVVNISIRYDISSTIDFSVITPFLVIHHHLLELEGI